MKTLKIRNLGPIGEADIHFGDLTIIIGPQASGKTIALETLKLALDYKPIIDVLNKNNYRTGKVENILNLYYGAGMSAMWNDETLIEVDGLPFTKASLDSSVGKLGSTDTVFYIPAQRVKSMMDGVGKSFGTYNSETPFVNRIFGDTVQRFVQNGIGEQITLFPMNTRLKGLVRQRFDDSIYHGAKVELDDESIDKRLVLRVGKSKLPTSVWSAGQREFTPLLLGVYCLTGPPQNVLRGQYYQYVVIEEPEMGLHPSAIQDVLLQILELMQGEKGPKGSKHGYKVIVSTHSSLFLDFAWAFNKIKGIKDTQARYNAFHQLMGTEGNQPMMGMLEGVLDKEVRTYYMGRREQQGLAYTKDITSLDVWDDDPIIGEWGGMTSFASRATDVLSSNILNYD